MTQSNYDRFIRNGMAVGFTDDQIDFLAEWIEIEEYRKQPTDVENSAQKEDRGV